MDAFFQPRMGAPVQFVDARWNACGLDLGHEALAQLPEAALDLALALGVAGPTRRDLGAVVGGEVHRSPMQLEAPAPAGAQRAHPVRARHSGHPSEALEGPHQALEGVVLVL